VIIALAYQIGYITSSVLRFRNTYTVKALFTET